MNSLKNLIQVLTNATIEQRVGIPEGFDSLSKKAKSEIRKERRDGQSELLLELRSRMNDDLKRANDIACEIGSSNWLTTLSLEEMGFFLTKQEFWDAFRLRYCWTIKRLPSKCACGSSFDISHSLTCKKGGFVIRRHNELRDITADLLSEVCHDVCIEPPLQPLTGETLHFRSANTSDEARLDVSARSVWARNQRAFFDIRVFNSTARRYNGQTLKQAYSINENEKKRQYNERVLQVENGTFTPLVFNVHGGMGHECKAFYQRLSELIADKRNEHLSAVSTWIRTKISFALLRSTLMCLRGSRSRHYRAVLSDIDMELDVNEAIVRPI